ncbi:uncharacterized protein RJT21DRAFT_132624 [Scheffersomyces amazonensis]|uniref:uncharacterized protein n=1 Tax=Scheffersomyces amazonensis TaxID=1078765 RepID=UPI00315C5327
MDEQEEDRKSRLAALRKNRNKNKNKSSEESVFSRTLEAQQVEQLLTAEVPESSDSTTLESQETTNQVQDQHSSLKDDTIPSLSISNEEGQEDTVEAISAKLQDEIFNKAHKEAIDTSFDIVREETISKKKYTEDLESDIAVNLNKAKFYTNKAINRLLQQRYTESVTE